MKAAHRSACALLAVVWLATTLAMLAVAGSPAMASGPVLTHVSYGSSAEEFMRIYPAKAAGSTTVILVHGGGWRLQSGMNTASGIGNEANSIREHHATVFDIEYPQDTNSTAFPLETHAVEAATAFAKAHAAEYNANPAKVVLVGGSAGGQLVERVAEAIKPAGVVALSGPTDFVSLTEAVRNGTYKEAKFITSLGKALGCEPRTGPCPESYEREWSPVDNIPAANCPPWLLFSAQEDLIPVSQDREMQTALEAAGCSSTLDVIPGKGHAFSYWSSVKLTIFNFIASV